MVLATHQRAKHFTCATCSRKMTSVPGIQNTSLNILLTFLEALVNHVKTAHGQTLGAIANAIKGRDDPETVPDVQGMDGIPTADLAEFTARITGQPIPTTTTPALPGRPRATWNLTHQQHPLQQQPAKRVKVDAPLDSQTIAAQLAEFQAKKEQEELASFIASGVAYPPGTSTQPAFFIVRFNPPGQGPWSAKGWTQLYPGSDRPKSARPRPWTTADGKSDSSNPPHTTLPPRIDSSNDPSSSPKLAAKCVSSPPFHSDLLIGKRPAPPPSLRFTKTDVILSLSPPTPGPLAPGQEPPKQPIPEQVVPAPAVGVPWQNAGGPGMTRGGRPMAMPRGMARGGPMGAMGRGAPNTYQVFPPPQAVNAVRPIAGRGGAPGSFPAQQPYAAVQQQYQPAYPTQPSYQQPGQYPPQRTYPGQQLIPPRPPNQPSQYGQYPPQQQQYPQGYPAQPPYPPRQFSPTGYSAPPMPAAAPPIPFEKLYPMHGKRASDLAILPGLPAVPGDPFPSPSPAEPVPQSAGAGPGTRMIITDDLVSPVSGPLSGPLLTCAGGKVGCSVWIWKGLISKK